MKTVEIVEPEFKVSTGAQLAVEGATVTFTPRECDILECPSHYYHCRPSFIPEGEKLRILHIADEPMECPHGYKLKLITTERIEKNNYQSPRK